MIRIDPVQAVYVEHAEPCASVTPAPVVDVTYVYLNDDLNDILGRPNFACSALAQVLRLRGDDIPRKSEREQAAVIHWLLSLYLKSPGGWREDAASEVKAIQAATESRRDG